MGNDKEIPGLLSILVPLYNEEEHVGALLERVLEAELPGLAREIVIVDDGSIDRSVDIVRDLAERHPGMIRLFTSPENRGKGAAIRRAIEEARGEFSIIQDADLEYDPREYGIVLKPLLEGRADAVYGSRFHASGERRVLYYWHSVANRMLTTICNIASDLNLTDMETCYKAFRTSLVKSIPLKSDRFGFEPEITLKLSKRQARVYEVPISYHGRTYAEGKKIGLKDAIEAVWCILKFAFTDNVYKDDGQAILHAFSQARRFNRWMADVVQPYLGSTVLEIGAGMGNLTRHLARGKRAYICTDIDSEHLSRLSVRVEHRPNVSLSVCDLAKPEHFTDFTEAVDSVVCLNVLEHIEDDAVGLRNIHSILREGGRAIVLVPQGMDVYGMLDKALGHYRRYSEAELRTKMTAAGFRVEKVMHFNRISRPGWYVAGRVFKRTIISPMQLRMFDRFVWLWRKIDKWLPWAATSLIAIGVKTVPAAQPDTKEFQFTEPAQAR